MSDCSYFLRLLLAICDKLINELKIISKIIQWGKLCANIEIKSVQKTNKTVHIREAAILTVKCENIIEWKW